MASSRPFRQRVVSPFVVICLTVSGLALAGISLMRVSAGSNQSTESVDQVLTETANGFLPVTVLNGSKVPGLARKTASQLELDNWTIRSIGNWSGAKLKQSTIFYPKDAKDSATALAKVVQANVEPASNELAQTALTYVIVQ